MIFRPEGVSPTLEGGMLKIHPPDNTADGLCSKRHIASDLGLVEVPVEIVDVDEWQAEYMLIAENTERRGEAESDPVKKGRQAAFLKEYWGVRDGSSGKRSLGGPMAHLKDVAEAIGESQRTTQRLIKLNDLIPEIQSLVSDGVLGVMAFDKGIAI